jgi:hypothetical protein
MKEVLMIADETTREAKEGNSQAGVGEPTAATHISPPTHPTLESHTPEVLPIPPIVPQGKPPSPIPLTTEATHIGSVLGSFMEGLSNPEGDVRGRGTEGGITPLISPSGKNCLT